MAAFAAIHKCRISLMVWVQYIFIRVSARERERERGERRREEAMAAFAAIQKRRISLMVWVQHIFIRVLSTNRLMQNVTFKITTYNIYIINYKTSMWDFQ